MVGRFFPDAGKLNGGWRFFVAVSIINYNLLNKSIKSAKSITKKLMYINTEIKFTFGHLSKPINENEKLCGKIIMLPWIMLVSEQTYKLW